ncbi:receptor kinase-like protein Xa21 [Durio zibethinus]|uniref:Receptor kinase-like protein Xa21 n=1 Tax=Durio zibethinus TaxID=66656 RepID=A0A6P5Z597_DURZI|nr:receptor kinase-like protein Xa21 [Durio zibethinus]
MQQTHFFIFDCHYLVRFPHSLLLWRKSFSFFAKFLYMAKFTKTFKDFQLIPITKIKAQGKQFLLMNPSTLKYESISSINNLIRGLNLLGLATLVVGGNDTYQQSFLDFKAKITGDQLRIMQSWNSSIHFCQWVLNLAGNSFNNEIPQEVGRLRRLEVLELSNNSINGEIHSNLSSCSKLRVLHIRSKPANWRNTGFACLTGSIPPSLGNLSSLETLALGKNGLNGVILIPESLGQLTNLSFFSIAANAISGIVPVSIFNLSKITSFDIGENKIQGTLPFDLGITMPYIEFFSVRQNQISGQFPLSISNASNLVLLQVPLNQLNENLPSFEKLHKLSRFLIGSNHFGNGGPSDFNFLCSLTNTTKLEYLELSENNFGGELPKCIGNLTMLAQLALESNNLQGNIPSSIGKCKSLVGLDLSYNNLGRSIPTEIIGLSSLSIEVALSSNYLTGVLPVEVGNLKSLGGLLSLSTEIIS